VSMYWKELMERFTTIYGKAIYDTIKTLKINSENRVSPLDSLCPMLKCASWPLDQLWGFISQVPLTCKSCVSMRWKELLELFNLVYGSFIHVSIWYLKFPSIVWVLSFYAAPTCWIFQVPNPLLLTHKACLS